MDKQLDVGDGIAGETVAKLMHDEIGILRRYGLDKKNVLMYKPIGPTARKSVQRCLLYHL
jgi:hypothetical protein